MLLDDAAFVVTDTETTGTDATRHRLIEIAAVKVVGGEIVDRFARLVNPGCAVPRRITHLTGISTAMVFDQPSVEDVLPQFLDFLGDGVLVAHNLGFDLRFINAELARLGRGDLSNEGLCTLRLARRLLRGLPSKSLGSVADFYGIETKGRHRAQGDAEITAEILLRFLSHLDFDPGLETLAEVLTFQHRTYSRTKKGPKHLKRIREEILVDLPDTPGVYFMKDARGGVLYIGKAKRLRPRVRSYFNAIEAHSPHIRRLIETVRDVSWTETGSELAALLLESKLIKAHKPRFNRAQRRYRNRPFLRLDTAAAFPRVTWQSYLTDDSAEYFGPMPSRSQAERVVDLIDRFFQLRQCDDDTFALHRRCLYADMGRCLAPCVGGEGAERYADEVQRVRDFLTGQDRAILAAVEAEMHAAAARMDYEEARAARDTVQTLEHLLARQECIAAPVLDHNAVLVQPGLGGGVQLFLVRFGRHVETLTLTTPPSADETTHLHDRLAHHFDPTQPRPERYLKQEVDEIRVLAHWMYVHRESTRHIPWPPDAPSASFAETILQQL